MYKEVLSAIDNISIYPLISFVVFFMFFAVITGWMLYSKPKDFEVVSKMPLLGNDESEL